MFDKLSQLASAIHVRNYLRSMLDNGFNLPTKDETKKLEKYLLSLEKDIINHFMKIYSTKNEINLDLCEVISLNVPEHLSKSITETQNEQKSQIKLNNPQDVIFEPKLFSSTKNDKQVSKDIKSIDSDSSIKEKKQKKGAFRRVSE